MRRWAIATGVTAVALAAAGAAIANHVTQADPAAVPTGFLAAHNSIEEIPLSALARAVTPNGADIFIQHVRLDANAPTGWHTHPGPALVEVVKGSVTYEEAKANVCRQTTYNPGGLRRPRLRPCPPRDRGPRAESTTVVYVLPPGSQTRTSSPSPRRPNRALNQGGEMNKKLIDDHAGRCVGNARRNVDGDGRPEDVGPEQRDSRKPQACNMSHTSDTGLNGMMNDRHVFDIMIPLVEASFAAGCTL